MQKHFVTFLSPSTFVAEETTRPIDTWDPNVAMEMAGEIVERYNATPYAFYFTTRERGDADLDSKVAKKSGAFFLGGDIETLADVEARNDPTENILRQNMRCNDIARIVVNRNSWKSVHPLREGDVVLDYTPPKREQASA